MALLPLRRLAARRESAYGMGPLLSCASHHRPSVAIFHFPRQRNPFGDLFHVTSLFFFLPPPARARRAKRTYPYPALKERTCERERYERVLKRIHPSNGSHSASGLTD